MQRPPRVLVTWEDCLALDDSTWVAKDEAFVWVPYLVESVGFLLYDGPEGIVITDSWTDGDHTGQRTQIPRGMIRVFTPEPAPRKRTRKPGP